MASASVTRLPPAFLDESLRAALETEVLRAESALHRNFSREWDEADVDLIFAHFVFGLVVEAEPTASPHQQLNLFQHLAGLVLSPVAVTEVLHASLSRYAVGIRHAAEVAEQLGRRSATNLRAVIGSRENAAEAANSNLK